MLDRLNPIKWQNKYNGITAFVITEGPKEASNDNAISSSNGNKNLLLIWKYHKFSGLLDKTIALFLTFGTIHHLLFHIWKNIIIDMSQMH